ncbi:MAG: hypothetical protein JXA01_08130 [Dehalococcoidia bacterium]|nr:hypothetical protein [Dehalococcoidia bacterium]
MLEDKWKTTNTKFCHILFIIIGLIILSSPSYVSAQEWKNGLILRHVADGYKSDVIPGESENFFIEVANYSYITTSNISFTYDAPKEWVVEFNPQRIDVLNAGSFQTVEVAITAPPNAEKGDYSVTIIADSDIGSRVISIYTRVNEGTKLWIWIGGMLGVIVVIAFAVIFIRFSRN